MGRSYNDAGLIGYQGIKFLHREEIPKMSEPETYSLTELIVREYKNGKSAEKLAKTYMMSIEEINKIIGEVIPMSKTLKEILTEQLEKLGVKEFTREQLALIAKERDIDMRPLAGLAGRMGVYNPEKPTPRPKKVNIDSELMEMIDTYEDHIKAVEIKRSMESCDQRLEEKAKELCLEVPVQESRQIEDRAVGRYFEAALEETRNPETIFYTNMSCRSDTAALTLQTAGQLLERMESVSVKVLVCVEEIA